MNRPRPAEPDLDAVANDLLLALGQLLRRLRSEVLAEDLNLSQASALARLIRDGAMTTADLARAESMKPQSMKAILATLEEDGCVERRPHPTDGRQILFEATAHGHDVRQQRSAAKRAWLTAALARCDKDEVKLLAAAIPLVRLLGEI